MATTKVLIGNIKGPKGDAGIQGPQGIQGEQGLQGEQGPAGTTSWDGISDKPSTRELIFTYEDGSEERLKVYVE